MSELRKLAEAAKGWSNITEIRPATEDDPCIMGALDDGEFYPVVTIDCEDYYVDSLPLAKFYAAATPKRVLGLLDEIERLNAEAVAADIRIENDKLEFQRIYSVLGSHAEITQKAEAEREAALADAKRYCFVLGMPSEVLLRLYNTRFDLRQEFIDAAMGEQP